MWRFVHLSDPHLGSQVDGQWNNRFLCTMMPGVMACLRGDLPKLDAEFILATGDLASKQTREAMFEARDMMDSLGIPYYPMGGNHDFVLEDSRAWFLEAFAEHLPQPGTHYSFTHKNLHFCVLDAWWRWRDGSLAEICEPAADRSLTWSVMGPWAIPPEQLVWLDEDLAAHADTATIIANHYPAIPIPARLQRNGLRDAGHLDNGDLLIAVAKKHPQVKALFSGNIHMHVIERVDGLTHVVTGALPEYPVEYREVRVYDDRLEIETHGLSDPSFAERALIPGKDFTGGQPGDRSAVIPL